MRLVLRRARQARGLLLAAAIAALVATGLVTGLTDYNRQAIEAGQRAFVASASPEERSLLVSGSAGRTEADFATRDKAVRDRFTGGLGGVPETTSAARYGTGRQLTGDLGSAPASKDPVFAAMTSLENLPAHADLIAGGWSAPGGAPLQVTLPQKAANVLEVSVGDRIPMRDRAAERNSEVVVTGIWRPKDVRDPYWRLAPGIGPSTFAESTTSYGPFVLDAADFVRTFAGTTTSAGWLVEPALVGVGPAEVVAARGAAEAAAKELPEAAGLGTSATVTTALDRLTDRMTRADLVGRSALLTPIMLVVVLGGYALVLVAALLNEDRRAQTALLRARGAARGQIAGLAAREAALVVVPGAALAPLLASQALRFLDSRGLGDLRLDSRLTVLTWVVAGAAAVGCLLTMLGPALRRGGTYVADLAARSRPDKWAVAQRASVDIALVVLAVLAWTQLRQYSSPLSGANGSLGVDPLLAAAPTLGVLAGSVIALRLLPPATRFTERFVDRKPWTATIFGMWQAGRRPHAGPVLLLALAVGAGTLAWSLVATWERSHVDQANHQVGADLRLRDASAPPDRMAQLAAVPGIRAALPAWRDDIRLGGGNTPAAVVALDATAGADVMRINPGLVDGPPRAILDKLAAGRPATPGTQLPADAKRLTGTVSTPVSGANGPKSVTTTALLTRSDGMVLRVPLATTGNDGKPKRFAIDLPDSAGHPLRLAGIEVDAGQANPKPETLMTYQADLTDLRVVRAGGGNEPADLGPGQSWVLKSGERPANPLDGVTGGALRMRLSTEALSPAAYFGFGLPYVRFTALRDYPDEPVPAAVTPDVLRTLSAKVGDTVPLQMSGFSFPVKLVGELAAMPGSDDTPSAFLLDLPSAVQRVLRDTGTVRAVSEWWIRTDPAGHAAAAEAVAKLPGVTVLDRLALARAADRDPYWQGARTGLFAAAVGAVLLALVGLGVDIWATARRRVGELAVLHTLGATPRLLARALLAEQAFLAGIGVIVGLLVGAGVGATMAPLVILTPSAGRPVPAPTFELPWVPVGAIAVGLLVVALVLGGLVATTIRQRVAAAQLRMGGDQ
jgi:hypothetical protein